MTLDDKFTAGAVEATEDCVGHESDEDLVRMYEPEGAGPRFALQQPERPEPAPSYELNGDVWKRPADSARGEAVVMCTGSLLYDRDLERTHTAGDVYEFRSLFSRVRACLESAALTIGSLRTVVVDEYHSLSTIPARYIDGQYSNAPSAYLDAIRYAGFDCLALAHAYNLDAGVRGVASTQRRVSEAGLVPSGLGTAKNPVFEVNGIRIGVLSFTVNASRADEWISAAGAERLLNIQTGSTMRRAVSEVRGAGAQFVLLYLDCRSEGTPLDLAARKQAAVAAAEAGADYVVCTRPPLVSRQLVHTTSDGRRVPIASGIGTFMAGPTNYIETPAAILRLILRTTDEGEIAVDDAYIPVRRFSLYRGVASPVVPDHPFYNPDYRAQDFDGAAETVAKKLGKAIRPDRSRTVTIDSDLRPQISPAEIADVLDTKFSRKVMRRLGSAFDAPVSIVAVQKEHLLPGSAAVLTPRTIAGVVPNRIRPEVPVAAGASMAIAKDPVPDVPTLVVDDPGAAFIRIATAIRERYRPLTVAVTGSAGKTTTMEMLAPIFERQMRTLMVKGNYNTPRGAARMIQKLSDDDEAYIQEVHGGSPGTASVASRMLSPDIAVITSIGDAHLQQLGTIEKVIEAKLQVIDGLVPGGTLIVNDDNEHLHAQHPPVRTLRCSRTDENCDFVARNIVQHEDGVEFDVVHPDGTTAVAVRSRGLHNVSNALLAFATARTAGVPAATIVAGLSRYRTRSVRQNLVEVGGYRLFVDAYNSNPLSLRSAVSTMCEMPVRDGARRIAVLGDMGEQGTKAAENHKAVGEFIADSRVDLVLCHGEGMAHTAAALQATGRPVRHAASPEDLIIDVRDHVRPGDLVLFKAAGSVDLVKTVVYPVFGKVVKAGHTVRVVRRRGWKHENEAHSRDHMTEETTAMVNTPDRQTAGTPVHESSPDSDPVVRLGKNLKPHWVWAIALGSAIGWGAFILPADWMRDGGGPLAAMLGLAIGGALMIVIGVSYGYLARVFPVSGGAFAYTLVGFGRTHAFICAWFMTLGYTSIVALNASALALLGKHTVPQIIELGHLYSVAGWDVYLGEIAVATLALVLFAVVNARGASLSGRTQFIFCLVMILAVVALVVGVLASPTGSFSNVTPLTDGTVNPLVGITVIVAIAPWAYIGFDNIPQAAEEFDFPAHKAFRLIFWSLIVAAALYCAMILATASAAPWQELMGEDRVWATADAITSSLGGVGLALLVIAALMGIVTGLNGFYVAGSRVLLALGRAQMIPRVFQRVHPRFGTPHYGILFVMLVSFIAPWFGRTALSWIVDMASIGFTFAFLYTSACAYRMLRWSGQGDRAGIEGSASTWRKLAAAAGVVIAIAFILLLLVPGSPAQLSVPSFLAMGAWIVIGAVFFAVRRSHNKTLTDEQVDQAVLGTRRPEFLVR